MLGKYCKSFYELCIDTLNAHTYTIIIIICSTTICISFIFYVCVYEYYIHECLIEVNKTRFSKHLDYIINVQCLNDTLSQLFTWD